MGAEKTDVYDSKEWVQDMMGKPKGWLVDCLRNTLRSSAPSASTNSAIMQLLGRFLTLDAKWMDYAGPVAVFRQLCEEARKLGATAQ